MIGGMLGRSLVLIATLLLPVVAAAEDQPVLAPQRDVTITYDVRWIGEAHTARKVRLMYHADGPIVRLDSYAFPNATQPYGSVVFNGPRAKRYVLMYQLETYVALDATMPEMPEVVLDGRQHYSVGGTDTVAGLPCTDWKTTEADKGEVTYCVTDMGFVLRSASSAIVLTASAVAPGAPTDAILQIPSDLRRIEPQPGAAGDKPGK